MLATGAVSAVSGGRDDVLLRRLRGLSTSRDDLLNFGKTESWIMRDPATRRETRYEAYSDPPRSTSRSERCCDFWREDSSLHVSRSQRARGALWVSRLELQTQRIDFSNLLALTNDPLQVSCSRDAGVARCGR